MLLRDAELEDRLVALENQAQFLVDGRADCATIARRPPGSSGDAFGGNHGVCLFAPQAACKLERATNSVRLADLFCSLAGPILLLWRSTSRGRESM